MGSYVPPPMGLRRGMTISDLILQRGDIAAQRAAQSGQIWGNALQNVGNIAAGAIMQHGEKKEEDKRSRALTELATSNVWAEDPQAGMAAAVNILGPRDGTLFAKGIMATAEVAQKPDPGVAQKNLPVIAQGWLAAPPESRQQLWSPLRQTMLGAQLGTEQDWPEQWSEEMLPQVEAIVQQFAPEEEAPAVGSDEWLASADPGAIEALRERRGILEPPKPEQTLEEKIREKEALAAAQARGTASVRPVGGGAEKPEKSDWGKPYKGADDLSYQYNETTGEVRLTPGEGRPIAEAAAKSQRGEAQKNVEAILGSPEGEDRDALYSLVMRNTMPGGELAASLVGMGGTVARTLRLPARADLEVYESQKQGFIPLLARAVGHTGVLTEQDVMRTERLLPVLTGPYADSREVAKRKLDRLRRIMSGQEKMPFEFEGATGSDLSPEVQAELDSLYPKK